MDELRARVSADVSGFMAGIKSSADATVYLKQATQQLKAAKNDLADAEIKLGNAVKQGSAAAKAAIMDYSEQVQRASAYVDALTIRVKGAGRAFDSTSFATDRMARSANLAASEMRVLDGSMMGSSRAAGQFLSELPLIGTAMQAAFPLFGAAALVMVLGQAVSGVEKLVEAFRNLTGEEQRAESAAIRAGDKILTIKEPSHLDVNEFARQWVGLPQDKKMQIPNEQPHLDQIRNARQLADIQAQNAEQGLKGAALQKQKVEDLQKEVQFAKQAAAETQKQADGYQKLIDARVSITRSLITGRQTTPGMFTHTTTGAAIGDPDQIKALEAQQRTAQAAVAQFQQDAAVAQAKIPGVQQHGDIDAQNEAQKEATREAKTAERAAMAQARAIHTVHDAIEQQEVAARFATEAHETLERTWEQGQKADEEAASLAAKAERERTEQWKKDHTEKLKALHAETEASIRQAAMARQATDRRISYGERTGTLTRAGGAAASSASVTTEENAQVGALQKEQAAFNPAYGEPDAEKYQQIQDQITAIQQKAADEREQIAQAEAERKEQINTQMFNQMYAPLQTFTDHWMTNGSRMGAAFAKMGDQYAMQTINALMKIGAQELIGLALHTAVGDQQRLSDAKTAAAGAYAATAGVPFIGPVLAPAAAAAAFAAVAAFDVGSDSVPSTGLAVVHARERIIPGDQNERITQALEGGGSGGSNHFHYSPTITGIDGASVSGMARQHGNVFMRQAQRMMRLNGGQ